MKLTAKIYEKEKIKIFQKAITNIKKICYVLKEQILIHIMISKYNI